ncbi:MAG TPA: DNA recombination protein RmuC [Terriglobales bacterium]|nr:DNA recombination protein RmuC [Terriglobales bacterium]
MLDIVLAVVAIVVAGAALYMASRRPPADDQTLQAVRNDLSLLRETTDRSIKQITDVFAQQLQGIGSNVQTALAAVNSDVSRSMSDTTRAVNDRIANVQATFGALQKQVGEMTEQARSLAEISKSISSLEHILSAPKLRGGFGEAQLENLLAMVFPREHFEVQYRFEGAGEVADAVIRFPQGMVAIDSKFPLENFRRMAEANNDGDRKSARREFLKDTKKRIDEIATKYIRPADGTLPFALMYVPAENVYYEAIIRDEEGNDLYNYCTQKRVMPVSPNSLYAYLQTIVVGMKSLSVSQRAETILHEIESLHLELVKFTRTYGVLGTHLRNAEKSYDDSQRALDKVQDRLDRLAGAGAEQPELPLEGKHALGAGGN